MVKPDIIISWPNNCDYPLWREFLTNNRARFNEVIIAITETNQAPNYTDFIKESLTPLHCQFVIPPSTPSGRDWRDIAVNQCLLHSYNAEWIWFTEQDFILTDVERFFEELEIQAQQGIEVMAYYDAWRMHPCCIFIKRSLLNKTSRFFGIKPNKYDHFYRLQKDIEALGVAVYRINDWAMHLNGLSSNMSLIARGEAPNYKPEQLALWVAECLKAKVPQSDLWVKTYGGWLKQASDL